MPSNQAACRHQIVEVDSKEGLCCPPLNGRIWSAHPRVYLAFPEGEDCVRCYYCSTLYVYKKKTEK